MICLNKDNEKYHYTPKLSKQKNAPFRGKFQGRLIMREIGFGGWGVVDDLDLGATDEGISIHIAPHSDAYFGEAGAIRESTFPNLRHRWWDGDAREAGATQESIFPNLRHRWWDADAREGRATRENMISNLCHQLRDADAREGRAT